MHADLQKRRQVLDHLHIDLTSEPCKIETTLPTNDLSPPQNTQNYAEMDVAGLVSSIITFVDFSWTIVRGTYDIHSSTSGATEENVHVGNVLQDLRAVTEKMRKDLPGRDDHEIALLELEEQCRALSGDLAAILQKLTVKRRAGLQSLNVMLRSLMREKEVREIEKRLGEYRAQMILRLNLILLERSVAMQHRLELMEEDESAQLSGLKQKAEALTHSNSVLRRLYFDDMYKRADSITDATYGTFDWLLPERDASAEQLSDDEETHDEETDIEDTPDPLCDQQEREDRQESAAKISEFLEYGDGVFFLRGKPGSGKSTLMKYLIEGRGKQEVDRKLRKWAGQKRLIRVSAMFLLHGTPLQRSLEGLYRTLFFELLCQWPELEGELFPKVSERELPGDSYTSSFRVETLQKAWHRLLAIKDLDKIRVCVSIDGMDEMEGNTGDRFKFAQALKEWAGSDDIKIICSGRPNVEFNVVFDQDHRLIDLQNLTRADIRRILREMFQDCGHLSNLTHKNVEDLVNDISDQSEGVILWAVLVGKSLEDDIIHGQSLNTMKRTIRALPSGIEDLFNNMFKDSTRDGQQQLRLRTICGLLKFGRDPRVALTLFWLDDALCDSDFPYNQSIKVLDPAELDSRAEKVSRQLIQDTRHFVEVFDAHWIRDDMYLHTRYCYRFIHRSAQEFFQSKFKSARFAQQTEESDIIDLDLRLNLIQEMSKPRESPMLGLVAFFRHLKKEQTHRQDSFHQLQPRLLDKLHELVEVRSDLLYDGVNSRALYFEWTQLEIHCYDDMIFFHPVRSGPFSLFHLALLGGHQIDYIVRILEDKRQKIGREDLSLGLLICAAGDNPSYELFNLLVDHGADMDCLVEVYGTESQAPSKPLPLWLLFCFRLACKSSCWREEYHTADDMRVVLYHEFLILERFLQLGYGSNTTFLVFVGDDRNGQLPYGFEPDEKDLLGVDLAQIVRHIKPDNMDRLLSLLESPLATFFSLAQKLTRIVLQPQFPLRNLPQDAIAIPYRKASDEFLIREKWVLWSTSIPHFGGLKRRS